MNDLPRVGFDAFYLEQSRTGSGQYALNVWRGLQQQLDDRQLRLLMPSDAPDSVIEMASTYGAIGKIPALSGRTRKLWWEQIGQSQAARISEVELVHVPYFAAPIKMNAPYVVTIHDVIPLVLPAYQGSLLMQAYSQIVRRTAARARLVLTDSEHSRRDIQKALDISSDRIRVIPLAAGEEYSPAMTDEQHAAIQDMRQRLGLERPFILNVGGFDRRKNLPALLEAFAMARPHLQDDYELVIVGLPHTGNQQLYPPIEPVIRRYNIEDRVTLTGFVDGDDFINLYRAAAVFAFVSQYEGFGLDPLEAMASGTAVVCSNRSSLPEVVGDGGYLVDPDPRSIAEGLVTVLNDPALRDDLVGRGLEQASTMSWKQTVDQTLNAYQDAIRMARGG